ncbi:MAG: M81 family metallopeptidase [Hyphomicrobiales bacterium]|nr:M81 family metallopeptidase [Hyphomicrobiales bacterium]
MAKRVLIAGFKHETNTFSKLSTTRESYEARGLHFGDEIVAAYKGTNTEQAAFHDACARHGWEPVLAVAANAVPSGKVARDIYETVSGHILETIDTAGTPDAVLLELHGAMVAEHTFDGEGTLLELIREKIGREVPIGVTLDLHANVTARMAELADIMVSYRTYPHVDLYDTGTVCADLMARTLAGEISPTVTLARAPLLDGVDHGRTTAPGPMRMLLERGAALEREPGVLRVSINAGFPWADLPETGPSALLVGDGGDDRYRALADGLADLMWETREELTVTPITSAKAIALARDRGRVGAPVVISDFADNPGGGGYGDATGLLRAMVEAGLQDAALAALYDPESVAACQAAGAGAELTLDLGGKVEPGLGAPVRATGTVEGLYEGKFRLEGPMATGVAVDIGPAAVFKVGGVEVVLASKRAQNLDRNYFKSCGIDPAERAVVAVKSAQHFRADYGPIASEIVVVDEGGGLTSRNFRELDYRHVRRPVWPLDEDATHNSRTGAGGHAA